MTETRFHDLATRDGTSRRIAFRFTPGSGAAADPTLVFLPGYMSDMAGSKACAVFDWARETGRACLLLDYSGCGESPGEFAEGTLSRWREEVLALIDAYCPGRVILIGSSMGGWLMLLVGLALGARNTGRLAGLVGIAAAPDFTDWGYTEAHKAELAAGRTIYEDNPYGPEPTPTHARFWQDGQKRLLLGGPIAIQCPVRLLQGLNDPDVPWQTALRLADCLESGDVQVTLIKHGDHRLSRPHEIALLLRTIESLANETGSAGLAGSA